MQLVFLGAKLPLTKTFVHAHGRITATPYPHVSRVTSFEESFTSLPEFKALLEKHAALNNCLFSGLLQRPISNESRAGLAKKEAREWIVFDFDKVPAKTHEEVVAKFLPAECQNVSYIAQLSASMYRPDTTTWSGHIFMLLKDPVPANTVKQWFEYLNFTIPALSSAVCLSDSLQALHWPLDRTVAHESKLIYIAPPKCHGFTPEVKEQFVLVKKRVQALSIGAFTPIDYITVRQRINDLRKNAGEPPIEYDLTTFEGHEMLRKTEVCSIEGIKTSGDHYIRFNLNGGDSYAYFIDLRNPEVIKNFKGEPYLQTKDAAPEIYKSLRRAATSAVSKPPLNDGTEVLAFYATNQGSPIKIGTFDPGDRRVTLYSSTDTAARAWRAEYGLVQKEHFPHYNLIFDPTSDVQFANGVTDINTFRATKYMAGKPASKAPSNLTELPPLVGKIIRSILGNPAPNVVEHFVNWLAFIFQERTKAGTAWVLNGVEGTGKGSFVQYYLRPLFGPEHVAIVQYANLRGEFNAFLENALFVVIEEADIKSVENAEDIMAKIKLWITDSQLPIRKMRTDVYDAPNFSNFILNTNTHTPANISGTDRRFNFGERQDQRWYPTPNELRSMMDGDELDAFADVLKRWPVKRDQVAMVIDTQAKRDAHEATTPINQLIAEALLRGDLQFFIDRIPSDTESQSDFGNRFNPSGLFKAKVDTFIAAANNKQAVILSEEDLFILFRTLIPDAKYFQDSKTWRKRHFKSLGLDIEKQHRIGNARTRGMKVSWLPVPGAVPSNQGNVSPITKGRKP